MSKFASPYESRSRATADSPRMRPFGFRASLGKKFLAVIEADFAEHGQKLIERIRRSRPQDYLRLVVGLLPEEVIAEKGVEDMTDDEIATALEQLRFLMAEHGPLHQKQEAVEGACETPRD